MNLYSDSIWNQREEEQQQTGTEGECRGERSERAWQHFGDRMHPAAPETREDAGQHIHEPDESAGPCDDGGYSVGAWSARHAP
ncbi:hypothetical protein [Streptomyces sp. NPDC096311]|uniref:hypothetical protein n=1 Tax=Streptomyces sp. NPDC096311 TaxID=3366083 RepID=UPI0037FFD6F8